MTYPLGCSMMEQMLVRRERWPGGNDSQGSPLVYPGQEVLPDQPVLRLARRTLQGSLLASSSEPAQMKLNAELRERTPSYTVADQPGTETITAGMHGRVVDITRRGGVVIESLVAVVQGVIGAGNQVAGTLTLWQSGEIGRMLPIPPGAILVVPGPITLAFLHQALLSGVSGLIASSMNLHDLEGFLQTDLISLFDRNNVEQVQTHFPPITLCLTEGLGNLAMSGRIMKLLRHYQGLIVLLSGVTSVRQSIVPELLISLPRQRTQQNLPSTQYDPSFILGVQVRVCSGEHEGKTGIIDYIFAHQQVFPVGIRRHAVRLRCDDGSALIVPLVLLERV